MQKFAQLDLSDLSELSSGGSYCVVGAPGVGKTHNLINLVIQAEANFKPEEILVLTASRQQAGELRNQISLRSGRASSSPRALSITGFAFKLLRDSGQKIRLLTGPSQEQILRQLITEEEKAIRAVGFNPRSIQLAAFIQELRDLLQVVLDFDLKLSDLVELQTKFPSLKLAALIVIFDRYLDELGKRGLVDASSLLTRALEVETKFGLILVDDAQEFSTAGLSLVAKLTKSSPAVLFGDPDAGTQGFRAAEPGSFLALAQNRIYLMREPDLAPSVQGLLGKLASRIPPASAGVQRSVFGPAQSVQAVLFDSTSSESDYLAMRLRRARLERQIPFSQMGIVVRTRAQVEQLAQDLALRDLPVVVQGLDQPLSRNQLTRAILDVASVCYQRPNRALALGILQSSLFGLTAIAIRRLERSLVHHFGQRIEDSWNSALELGVELDTPEIRALNRLVDLFREVSGFKFATAHELVSRIFEVAPNNLRELAKSKPAVAAAINRDLDATLRLFAAAMRFDEQAEASPVQFVQQQLDQRIVEDALFAKTESDAVTITTPSALAGKRFEIVAIPRLQDGIWPNLKLRNSMLGAGSLRSYLSGRAESPVEAVRGELADELRLFYKAIGASRSEVLLSAMQSEDEQPSQFFTIIGSSPEPFEGRIDFDLRRFVGTLRRDLAAGDKSAAGLLALLALAEVPGAQPESWHGLLDVSSEEAIFTQDEQVTLNASSLQAFETCPLHWFVETFAVGRQSFQASVGTLLHRALELAQSPGDIANYVESNWHELEFELGWQERAQRQRAMEMAALLASYLAQNNAAVAVEQGFELEIGRLRVRGKIDRVEQSAEGLVVADLKTGKSIPEVEGNRQLALYQLAISRRHPEEKLSGAKLISVGTGELKVLEQPALTEDSIEDLNGVLEQFEQAATNNLVLAKISSHCNADSECTLLVTQAVRVA